MNTHLRKLIAEVKERGWHYDATQTNGSAHFVHPVYGRVAVASTPADWEDECCYVRQRLRKAEKLRREKSANSGLKATDQFGKTRGSLE